MKMLKRCGCCLLIVLLVLGLIIGGLVGAGFWAWDAYVKDELGGVTLTEFLDLAKGLYKYDESGIVTKAYDKEADLQGFNDAFVTAFGLDRIDGFDVSTIDIEKILKGEGLDDFDWEELKNKDYENQFEEIIKNGLPEGLLEEHTDTQASNFYTGIVVLGDTGETPALPQLPSELIPDEIQITDKQVAAVVNKLLEDPSAFGVTELESIKGFLNGIELKQVAVDENSADMLTLNVVFKVDVLAMVAQAIDKGNGAVDWAMNNLIPENIYFSFTIHPTAGHLNTPGYLIVNDFDKEGKRTDTVNRIFGALFEKQGGFTDAESGLTGMDALLVQMNKAVSQALGSVESYNIPLKIVAA